MSASAILTVSFQAGPLALMGRDPSMDAGAVRIGRQAAHFLPVSVPDAGKLPLTNCCTLER